MEATLTNPSPEVKPHWKRWQEMYLDCATSPKRYSHVVMSVEELNGYQKGFCECCGVIQVGADGLYFHPQYYHPVSGARIPPTRFSMQDLRLSNKLGIYVGPFMRADALLAASGIVPEEGEARVLEIDNGQGGVHSFVWRDA